MKYVFVIIAILGFLFTCGGTAGEVLPTGLGIATAGFAVASAMLMKK